LPFSHPEGRLCQIFFTDKVTILRLALVTVLWPDYRLQFPADRNYPNDYLIDLTARERTPPNPMITVSNNNQTKGVILDFITSPLDWIRLRAD